MDTPIIVIAIMGISGLLVSLLAISKSKVFQRDTPFLLTTIILLAVLGIIIFGLTPFTDLTTSSSLFHNDLLASFFALTVVLVSLFVVVSSRDYIRDDPNPAIYYGLIIFSTLGMVLLAYSVDLIMIIVAWELMGLPTYVLAGFRKNSVQSNEAAVKYFILGAFSTGILLYAVSLIFGLTGSTSLVSITSMFVNTSAFGDPLAMLALALFIAGFGLKLSIVPFHMWVPDVYQGAPTTIGALLSAGTKKAGFVVVIRIFIIALPFFSVNWTTAFAVLALATMTLGNVAALTQKNIKRLLAYSSIAQAGYILIGLAVATGPVRSLALIGVLFHVFNHAIMQSSAFLAVAAVDKKTSQTNVEGYAGLWKRMPITSVALTVALLALAGMPPLNGFWSKLILFTAAIQGEMIWLAIAGVLNSAFSMGYYAWVIKRMYLDEPEDKSMLTRIKEPRAIATILIIATLVILILGIYPNPIYELAKMTVSAI